MGLDLPEPAGDDRQPLGIGDDAVAEWPRKVFRSSMAGRRGSSDREFGTSV